MDGLECRAFELRQLGERRLVGTAVRYGDTAKLAFGRERFMPGAFGDVKACDVILNRQHQRTLILARTGGGGLTLDDNERRLLVSAELPETREAQDAIVMVQRKLLRGFSLEFRAREERFENRTRIIERAELVGVSLVDTPAYSDSQVALRALGLANVEEFRALVQDMAAEGLAADISADRANQTVRRRKRWL